MKTASDRARTLDRYLRLPYAVEVLRNEDGYFAHVVELPGCMTWTDRLEDLWPMIEDAMRAWIGVSLEDGDDVPLPDASVSRGVDLRMPDDLYRIRDLETPDGLPGERFVIRMSDCEVTE